MELHAKEIEVDSQLEGLAEKDVERQSILKWVRSWGGSASDAVLDPSNRLFKAPGIEGLIGYRIESNCAVIFGDPIAPSKNFLPLTQAFKDYSKENGWSNIIYLTASEHFSRWALAEGICSALVEFGQELTINPQDDPRNKKGVHASLVRRKVKHALHENSKVLEYVDKDTALEGALEEVARRWLSSRKGPQIYTSHVRLFDDRLGKRWFYAKQGEKIVGTIVLNELQANRGWLINHLMITPDAPHGTPELLVVTALETLAQEGCHFATFGSVPAHRIGEMIGFNRYIGGIARTAFAIARKIFRIDGHRKFWEKFHPEERSSYLAFYKPQVGMNEMQALFRALNVNFFQ